MPLDDTPDPAPGAPAPPIPADAMTELARAATVAADEPVAITVPPSTGVTLLRPESFEPYLRVIDILVGYRDLVSLLLQDATCGWGMDVITAAPPPPALGAPAASAGMPPVPSAHDLERATFLGQVLGLGPRRSDFVLPAGTSRALAV
jgi:hypothetical protein